MLPRYELNARLPERGTDLILKDEWRPNQRPASTLRPCARTSPYARTRKAPGSSPIWVGKPGAFSRYPLRRYLTRQPLLLWQPDGYALGAS